MAFEVSAFFVRAVATFDLELGSGTITVMQRMIQLVGSVVLCHGNDEIGVSHHLLPLYHPCLLLIQTYTIIFDAVHHNYDVPLLVLPR